MKALILTMIVFFSMNAFAMVPVSPEQMTEKQKDQLIQLLNELEPAMIESLLTEEALDWYIGQFTRGEMQDKLEGSELPVSTGAVDGIGGFDDPNAPQFL